MEKGKVVLDDGMIGLLNEAELFFVVKVGQLIALHGEIEPTNEELAELIGWGMSKLKKVKRSLRQKQVLLTDEQVRAKHGNFSTVPMHFADNTISVQMSYTRAASRPQPEEAKIPEPEPSAEQSHDDFLQQLKDDRQLLETASMSFKQSLEETTGSIDVFYAEKQALNQDQWKSYGDFRRHFYNWSRKRYQNKSKQYQAHASNSSNRHEPKADIVDIDQAARVFARFETSDS